MRHLLAVAFLVVTCGSLFSSPTFAQRRTRPAAAKDTVSKREALAVIAGFKTSLQASHKAIYDKYDYSKATATLRRAFEVAGVKGRAFQYASSWGPNDVYLALNRIDPFYNYHLEQLSISERRINQSPTGVVRRADLQRLTNGVRSWDAMAAKAMAGMDAMTAHYGRRAAALEKMMEFGGRSNAATPKERPYWESRKNMANDIAVQEGRGAGRVKQTVLSPISKVRLFEAVSPVDSTAVCPVPKPLVLIPIPPFTEARQ